MKYISLLKKILSELWIALLSPTEYVSTLNSRVIKILFIVFFGNILLGFALNYNWRFPHFYEFVLCFSFIGLLCLWAIIYFINKINIITSHLLNQPAATKANAIFFRYCIKSKIYIICPLLIVFIFGIGGCSMFEALELTPTFFWIMIYFSIIVYISIIGYLQYLILAIYIRNLARGTGHFTKLPKSFVECVPAQIDWIQDLTKLSHTYRICFFSLGSTYILAFSVFCWLPEMQADTTSIAFYALWITILIAIVFLFPVISILEYTWIREIVKHLKICYIKDLIKESNIHYKIKNNPVSPSLYKPIQMICTAQIINSQDYPLKSVLTTIYSLLLAILNISVSVLTLVQESAINIVFFLHIFLPFL